MAPRIPIDVPSFTEYQNGKIKFGKAMKRKHFLLEVNMQNFAVYTYNYTRDCNKPSSWVFIYHIFFVYI